MYATGSHCYIEPMDGPGSSGSWQQGSDADVEARLTEVLAEVSANQDPCARLGCDTPEEARAAFLAVSKSFHPNRFARRPEEIRRLASEVFLLLKESYEEVQSRAQEEKLTSLRDAARAKANAPRTVASRATGSDSPEREDLRERRRDQLRKKLQGTTPQPSAVKKRPTAQIRAATPSEVEPSGEEERFERARSLLQEGDLNAASTAFRELAIARTQEKRFRLYMHYTQGRIHQREGRHDEARSEYKRALGLDASFAPALQSMSSLPDDSRRRAGLFSKLFRK